MASPSLIWGIEPFPQNLSPLIPQGNNTGLVSFPSESQDQMTLVLTNIPKTEIAQLGNS
jgi:hypothetical protein